MIDWDKKVEFKSFRLGFKTGKIIKNLFIDNPVFLFGIVGFIANGICLLVLTYNNIFPAIIWQLIVSIFMIVGFYLGVKKSS